MRKNEAWPEVARSLPANHSFYLFFGIIAFVVVVVVVTVTVDVAAISLTSAHATLLWLGRQEQQKQRQRQQRRLNAKELNVCARATTFNALAAAQHILIKLKIKHEWARAHLKLACLIGEEFHKSSSSPTYPYLAQNAPLLIVVLIDFSLCRCTWFPQVWCSFFVTKLACRISYRAGRQIGGQTNKQACCFTWVKSLKSNRIESRLVIAELSFGQSKAESEMLNVKSGFQQTTHMNIKTNGDCSRRESRSERYRTTGDIWNENWSGPGSPLAYWNANKQLAVLVSFVNCSFVSLPNERWAKWSRQEQAK